LVISEDNNHLRSSADWTVDFTTIPTQIGTGPSRSASDVDLFRDSIIKYSVANIY